MRYLNADDMVMSSADMTIMSGRGLNITAKLTQNGGKLNQRKESSKGSDLGADLGRLETDGDDEFDVQMIKQIHSDRDYAKKMEEE